MGRRNDSERERRRLQAREMSEERKRRSLRSEDFRGQDGPSDAVRFQQINDPGLKEKEGARPRPSKNQNRAFANAGAASAKGHTSSARQEAQKAQKEAFKAERAAQKESKKRARDRRARARAMTRHESNFSLIAGVVLLSFIGLVMVTSSSYYYAYNTIGDSLYFFRKQLLFLVIGGAAAVICSVLPLSWFRRLAFLVYLVSVLCLVAVLFVGIEAKGSRRWLGAGSVSFQPAELAKLGVALFMAVKVDDWQKTIKTGRTFLRLLFILAVPTVLVLYQNLSSGLIIGCVGLIIMFVGGCRLRYFVILGLSAAAAFGLFVVLPGFVPLESYPAFMQGFIKQFMYRSNRVEAFLDPFSYAQSSGYQTVQSLYAVGSGGFFGLGLGESIQKLGFIPEAYNDIIFAVICEELGLFGATIVVLLFGIVLKEGIQIAIAARNRFSTYVAAGIVGQIAIQAILNIAVNTNSIPATGVSLPFISYGGSSILFLMSGVGILLNISRYTKTAPVAAQPAYE